MKDNYVIIMAGGIGSRFWPMSRTNFPKQFHDVLGIGKSLLQLTVERFEKICPIENVLVVTNKQYAGLVKEQIPELNDDQILLEPSRKNTAPCIAYASYKIFAKNENAKLIVAPSDHLILKQEEFQETMELALSEASKKNTLITLGIKPNRPDTGYGYIQFKDATNSEVPNLREVVTFTEKPPFEIAKRFLESGDFYWNSGMFIWSAKSIIDAFNLHQTDLHLLFKDGLDVYNTPEEQSYIDKIYPLCTNISIDNGIMETASNVNVILADLGWSDLGTWGSLYTHIEKDDNENAVIGKQVKLYDSSNNVVMMPEGKLAVIQGLDDYIIVESNDTLLICKKHDEQKIKMFVNDLKSNKQDQFV